MAEVREGHQELRPAEGRPRHRSRHGARQFVVLIGDALRMIAGLEDISDGTISIGDRVVNASPRGTISGFPGALSPHDRPAISASTQDRGRDPDPRPRRWAADTLGLGGDGPHARRSGGQRQRVAMGRAICPIDVFLFDEPLSNLVPSCACRCAPNKKLHKRCDPVVYVTTTRSADLAVGHHARRPWCNRHPARCLQQPRRYLRRLVHQLPPMNMIPAPSVSPAMPPVRCPTASSFRRRRARRPPRRREVVLGIRAGDLTVGHGTSKRAACQPDRAGGRPLRTLGTETMLFTTIGGRVAGAQSAAGRRRWLDFELAVGRLHVFDASGRNVLAG